MAAHTSNTGNKTANTRWPQKKDSRNYSNRYAHIGFSKLSRFSLFFGL